MAYNAATVLDGDLYFVPDSGQYRVIVTYTGNAGEAPVKVPYTVNTTDVSGYGTVLRSQAMTMIAVLNSNAQIAAAITLPKVLDVTTPIPPPTASVFGSYFAATDAFTPGATPQDVFTISGSASLTVIVRQILLSTRQTTAGSNGWQLLARSTANSGGTSAAVTAVKTSATYSAATAAVLQYTANPTAGNLVGRMWSGWVASPAPATALVGDIVIPLLPAGTSGLVLTGTSQVLAVNFNGAALPAGLSVRTVVQWDERS